MDESKDDVECSDNVTECKEHDGHKETKTPHVATDEDLERYDADADLF